MTSHTTRDFRELFRGLPRTVRLQARAAYRLFMENPSHPGLHFKKIDDETSTYSVRIGLHYRALGVVEGSEVTWYWIGTHAEYNRMV